MVRGESPGPAPACHARASNWRLDAVELTDVAPAKAAQVLVPRVDGALTGNRAPAAGKPARRRIGVVDAVAAS